MPDRYHCETPVVGSKATLTGAEAHHLARVMRASNGTLVLLFDGSGDEYAATVAVVSRDRVELDIVERRAIDREAPRHITLAVALPKGDRQRWLVEKSVELGVACLIPLVTARGVAQPTAGALDRLRRAVVEASKQCGRNRLMQIAEPADLAILAERATAADQRPTRWLAQPGAAASAGQLIRELPLAGPTIVAIGPEGGLTAQETEAASAAGWQPVSLGPRVLRVETAALALAALLNA